jgi:hypothetical protein
VALILRNVTLRIAQTNFYPKAAIRTELVRRLKDCRLLTWQTMPREQRGFAGEARQCLGGATAFPHPAVPLFGKLQLPRFAWRAAASQK